MTFYEIAIELLDNENKCRCITTIMCLGENQLEPSFRDEVGICTI